MNELFGLLILIAISLIIGMIITLPILGIMYIFEDEINFQIFYFKLFLRFLLMVFLWIMHFGTNSYTLWWSYNDNEYEITIPTFNDMIL